MLFARLLQYRAYREVAAIFAARWQAENQRFARAVALEPVFAKALPELVFEEGPEEFARIAAAAFAPKTRPAEPEPEVIVEELNEHLHVSTTTIAAEERTILDALLAGAPAVRSVRFSELVRGAGELETAVVRFLALLELYKEGAVTLNQDAPLGEISVSTTALSRDFVPHDPADSTAAGSDTVPAAAAPELQAHPGKGEA